MEAAKLAPRLLARKGDARPVDLAAARENQWQYRPSRAHLISIDRDKSSVSGAGVETTSPAKDRVRLTLRLDQDRHRVLRLLSVHTGRSLQDILTAALDEYVAEFKARSSSEACACLSQLPDGGTNR